MAPLAEKFKGILGPTGEQNGTNGTPYITNPKFARNQLLPVKEKVTE